MEHTFFNILVIDDNIDDFELCERVLKNCPKKRYNLYHAKSGKEGLDHISNNIPDCILLDYSIPGIQCAQLIEKIRKIDNFVPIIILTGQGNETIAVTLMKAGAQDYVTKNMVSTALLDELISTSIDKSIANREFCENKKSPYKILIIDDNPDDREMCVRHLKKIEANKYSCIEASSGDEGLKVIDDISPDCVLLDYSLPGQNGLVVLKNITKQFPFMPVIMMTGQGNENIAVQSIKEGAQNYLVKANIDKDTLNGAVHSAIENSILELTLHEKEEELVASQTQLTELVNFQNLMLSLIPDIVFVKDKNLNIVKANPAFLSLYPKQIREDIIGQTTLDLYTEEEANAIREDDKKAFDQGHIQIEEKITFPDDTIRTMHTTKIKFKDTKGEEFLLGFSRDITNEKKAEEEIIRSNIELERFAYVASHDLQEPLRMVANFTMLLEKKYGDKLDETAQEYLRQACGGAIRMQALVADLLEYSRIGHDAESLDDICIRGALKMVKENLAESINASGAIIKYDEEFPVIRANAIRFVRVMQNLIGNAIKYQKPGNIPEITITACVKEPFCEICVSDNGIGMRQEYCKKIFEPFKRLHAKHEYSGTGMGLAICRRIIEGFGGTISAKSEPEKGSVFCISIPLSTYQSGKSDTKNKEAA